MPAEMMIRRLDRAARWLAMCLATSWLLAACGPGGGGTGTGPIVFSGSSLQGALSASAPAACAPQCGAIDLVVQEARVELATDCRLFRHEGDWGVEADGHAALSGLLTTTIGPDVTRMQARLTLQFSDGQLDSARVVATVLDEAGQPVLGPFTLHRGASIAAAFGSCPAR